MLSPEISVIVPVYNAERYINRCVDSILNQTFTDFELLLIDDGSKDNSGKICDEIAATDSRVKVFHKPNNGVSSARNTALQHSKGKYVMFLDSDDQLAKSACLSLIDIMDSNEHDCVIFGTKQTGGNEWKPQQELTYSSVNELKGDFSYLLESELLCPCWNKIYRKELIKVCFDPKMSFGEDLCFNLDYLANCNKVRLIPNILHFQNDLSEGSLTKVFDNTRLENIENFRKKLRDFFNVADAYNSIDRKYINDIIRQLHIMFNCRLPLNRKKLIINDWYPYSHLKALQLNTIKINWKDKVLLMCIHFNTLCLYDLLLKIRRLLP